MARPGSGARHPSSRQYWLLQAIPKNYRLKASVDDLEKETWTTKGSLLRAGDRVVIWQAQQGDPERRRGIVALGEVLSDPVVQPAANPEYWVDPRAAAHPEARAWIRYVKPRRVPLWLDDPSGALERIGLSVVRAPQGTVFRVSPDQWDALLEAVGGWPTETQ